MENHRTLNVGLPTQDTPQKILYLYIRLSLAQQKRHVSKPETHLFYWQELKIKQC